MFRTFVRGRVKSVIIQAPLEMDAPLSNEVYSSSQTGFTLEQGKEYLICGMLSPFSPPPPVPLPQTRTDGMRNASLNSM